MDVELGFETDSDPSTNFTWPYDAPGAKLTSFASRLAMLEKAAAGLGALGFIWASGVLLGGFASSLAKTDFWFINVILLIEGIRIFSRRQIIRWQHHTLWSLTGFVRKLRPRTIRSGVHFALAKASRCSRETVDNAENTDERSHVNSLRRKTLKRKKTRYMMFSLVLYCFQLASSTTCVTLSLMKLIKHICGDVGDANERNQQLALNIFYSLALAEALLFLLEKAYSEWMIMHRKLLEEVNRECQLGPSSIIYVTRFFDDAFSACVNGSIFDGRQKDMVSFAMDLLASNVMDDQSNGAIILQKFAANDDFSYETLQKVGITTSAMVRLVEMLNWKAETQKEIRQSAAEVLVKLAGPKHKPLQVAGIPGVMESISSLLDDSGDSGYDYQNFINLGLRILKKLCRDLGSCGKIGNTRGLLPKIIKFTYADKRLLRGERTEKDLILRVKRSLQVVARLSNTTGTTGKKLRREISEVVGTISKIRNMLQHGEKHPGLQHLGIEILTCLALEEDGRELVGCTGNVIKELFNIYLKQEMPAGPEHLMITVKVAGAGQALSVLALESNSNCHRILKLKVMESLVKGLEDQVHRLNAARILRHLCAYSGGGCFDQLRDVVAAAPTVLKGIFTMGDGDFREVMVGLAAQVFKFMTTQESSAMFEVAEVQEAALATALVQILKLKEYPPEKYPRMRRYVAELAIVMMRDKDTNVQLFKNLGMEKELEHVLETTVQHESFETFSGPFGVS
ncbi:hypothetical protein RJ639_011808 [Escallonia herrerae]|uniref:ARM repeat superfamily protein n=1 Tax=Escallonia herrerae TaxID=1293975 RepID=A0AA88VMA9_9ASTE|nr:hypothetical protein RJ639_015353 [Escallonia herrerae]KAK3010643.1 hypothetical protein RJ639_011808 [Escallonia herrerae]